MMARKLYNLRCSIVETKQGKLRGFQLDSTHFPRNQVRGVKRWEMPTPVEPWEGVRMP